MSSFYVLVSFVLGWLIAQVAKVVVAAIVGKGKLGLSDIVRIFVKSGGMPSGHTASLTAVTVTIGFVEGFGSAMFALAVAVTSIVIYDAVNVRYAVGKQGRVINDLLEHHKSERDSFQKTLRVVEGHTVLEAAVGLVIGLAVGMAIGLMFV